MEYNMNTDFSRRRLLFHSFIILALSVAVGIALLSIVYMLPTEPMKKNVAAAYDLFMDERVYHDWSNDVEYTRLDGYTDMLMYGAAIYPRENSVLKEALLVQHMDMVGEDGMDVAYYSTDAPGEYIATPYAVYWHGYLVWLKPLLLIMNPRNIRIFNMIIQFVLVAYLLQMLVMNFGGKYFLSFISGLLVLNTISTAMCLQLSSIFYISVIGMIIVLKYPGITRNIHNYSLFFLVLGICVAYFDFLTYPPIALCMPLMTCLALRNETVSDENTVMNNKSIIMSVFRAGLYWTAGYAVMWICKWFIAPMVGYYSLEEILGEFTYRSGMTSESFAGILLAKIKVLMIKPFIIYFAVCMLYIAIKLLINMKRKNIVVPSVGFIVADCLVMIIPIAWYFVVRQHSTHTFTYRDLAGTIMAVFMLAESFGINNSFVKEIHQK